VHDLLTVLAGAGSLSAVTVYVLIRAERAIDRNTQAIHDLRGEIIRLTATLHGARVAGGTDPTP
jgi:hypothetical protein